MTDIRNSSTSMATPLGVIVDAVDLHGSGRNHASKVPGPVAPPGAPAFNGEMPGIRIPLHDNETAHLTLALDSPSWVTLWAHRQLKRLGWALVPSDRDDFYQEVGEMALQALEPAGTRPAPTVIRTMISTPHRGVLESYSLSTAIA